VAQTFNGVTEKKVQQFPEFLEQAEKSPAALQNDVDTF
jgi:hypothetical protein